MTKNKLNIYFKIIIIWSLINFLFVIAVYLFYNYDLNSATEHCPIYHRFNKDFYCWIKDTIEDKILVEHYNNYSGNYQLSIYHGNKSREIIHPMYLVDDFDKAKRIENISFYKNDSLMVEGYIIPIIKK